ncbi:hypothetical protein XAPC_299 [Xanthomonas citri pv. punicae str. LMG 859]|nr:hypothetical protein XAPC_299 [Xanthomonas citri pv. punicae str. LMG 859]
MPRGCNCCKSCAAASGWGGTQQALGQQCGRHGIAACRRTFQQGDAVPLPLRMRHTPVLDGDGA